MIVTGIAAVGDVKAVGRVGVKALIYFTCASVFGLIIANVFQPGAGLSIDPSTLDTGAIEEKSGEAKGGGRLHPGNHYGQSHRCLRR
ncbi:Na+/H+-dicarboxylate symporter [Glutamicibacter nicotianae]|nr:Na+/H+-dicarboxylate symporter [Glutamicibacter nicotianae]